jgi:hypothetical protein
MAWGLNAATAPSNTWTRKIQKAKEEERAIEFFCSGCARGFASVISSSSLAPSAPRAAVHTRTHEERYLCEDVEEVAVACAGVQWQVERVEAPRALAHVLRSGISRAATTPHHREELVRRERETRRISRRRQQKKSNGFCQGAVCSARCCLVFTLGAPDPGKNPLAAWWMDTTSTDESK